MSTDMFVVERAFKADYSDAVTIAMEYFRPDSGSYTISDNPLDAMREMADTAISHASYISESGTFTVTNKTADAKGKLLMYKSLYSPQTFTQANKTVLYLSDNGVLLFPNGESPVTVGAFRAYFHLTNLMGGDGTVAQTITTNIDLPQGIEEIVNEKMQKCENVKIIKNGLLFIERNGRIYNANGKLVKQKNSKPVE